MKKKMSVEIIKTVTMALLVSLFISAMAFAENIDNKTTININQATAKELTALKGIGKKKAEAIIAYRESNGKFASVEDLTKVKGINKNTIEDIRANIVAD
ncbi:MAG: helix-hairpin-helix domain-containing protein [Nitrospiraceae bacterium]|nr:MAG: helix-hairpin-helix domain-containing protein [Nitrospiraceae bacterium]